ncbi:MAG: hypothetical protein ABI867_39035 [Kofleriaceae bacterium]
MAFRCPICGSSDVRGGKTNLPAANREANAYDFYCFNCKTSESHRDDSDGFADWYRRWLVTDRP